MFYKIICDCSNPAVHYVINLPSFDIVEFHKYTCATLVYLVISNTWNCSIRASLTLPLCFMFASFSPRTLVSYSLKDLLTKYWTVLKLHVPFILVVVQ